MKVRIATPRDARGIADIHVRAWQVAYDGIVPAPYLAGLSTDERETMWNTILNKGTAQVCVAVQGDEMLGWICVGGSRDPDAQTRTAEVRAVYVDPNHWRRGVGRALWRMAMERSKSAGFSEVTLWVLEANANSIAFYASLGFARDEHADKIVELGGAQLKEIRLRVQLPHHPELPTV